MFWFILATGWLVLAPLTAWAVATSVALAESAPRPSMADETDADIAAQPETPTETVPETVPQVVLEPGLVPVG